MSLETPSTKSPIRRSSCGLLACRTSSHTSCPACLKNTSHASSLTRMFATILIYLKANSHWQIPTNKLTVQLKNFWQLTVMFTLPQKTPTNTHWTCFCENKSQPTAADTDRGNTLIQQNPTDMFVGVCLCGMNLHWDFKSLIPLVTGLP